MPTKPMSPPWSKYKPGDKNQVGETIRLILNKTNQAIIYYVKEDNSVRWEYDREKCINANEAISISQALTTEVGSQLPESKKLAAYTLIDHALGVALNSKEEFPICEYFKETRLPIDSTLSERVHLQYIAIAMASTILLSVPAFLFFLFIGKNDIYYIFVSAFFGGCGALVSLLQRFSLIPLPKYTTWRFNFVRALSRILLGAIFGALLVIFHKAGLVLSILGVNSFVIYSLAFISGVSERMVPELISDLQDHLIFTSKK